MAEQDAKIAQHLSQANYYITDDSQLTTITGQAGFRIEQVPTVLIEIRTNADSCDHVVTAQWMTCLLTHLLQKHYEWIDGPATREGKRATRGELSDQEWYDMDSSLFTLVLGFHYRMRALVRGWRSQKIDVGLQIETFAGGVYEGWYNAVSSVTWLKAQVNRSSCPVVSCRWQGEENSRG